MVEKITFGDADFKNLEVARQIVLRRLKEDPTWCHMPVDASEFDRYVNFPSNQNRERFLFLVREVIWDLLFQGVISPGENAPNPNLPWFHITDYGREVVAAERFVPHDPVGYIKEIRAVAKMCVSEVTFTYLEEALRCFTRGCHMASVLLLGVCAESVFLNLCNTISHSLKGAKEKKKFSDLNSVKSKHRWIISKFESLPREAKREQLPESLDTTLGALYDLIRCQRNDLGHPQDSPPRVPRDLAFVFFRLFPTYVGDVETFANFCKVNGL